MTPETTTTQSGNDTQLKALFTDQLHELYWAEKKLAKTLLKMQKSALHQELKEAFEHQYEQTLQYIALLENVFQLIGEEFHKSKSPAMAGILAEGKLIMEDRDDKSHTTDVALIMVTQQAKHFEIASYGCLSELAKTIGLPKVHSMLYQILQQQKQADALLTLMAVSGINQQASYEPASSGQ